MVQRTDKKEITIETAIESDYETWGLLVAVNKLIGQARTLELSRHGLTPQQSQVLHILTNRGGSTTMKDIADIALRRHNSVSVLIKRMELAGLVNRIKTDFSNQYQVTISEKGRRLVETMPTTSVEMILASLSSEEKRALVTCLTKLDQKARHILRLDYLPPF